MLRTTEGRCSLRAKLASVKPRKKTARAKIAQAKKKIETQRKRAQRPTLPVNTQARVSESLVERKRREERRRLQKRDWENL
jgi:hypothetical protein